LRFSGYVLSIDLRQRGYQDEDVAIDAYQEDVASDTAFEEILEEEISTRVRRSSRAVAVEVEKRAERIIREILSVITWDNRYPIYTLITGRERAESMNRDLAYVRRKSMRHNGDEIAIYVKPVGGDQDIESEAVREAENGSKVMLIFMLPELYYYANFENARESDELRNLNLLMVRSIAYKNPATVIITSEPNTLKEITRLVIYSKEIRFKADEPSTKIPRGSPPGVVKIKKAELGDLVLPEEIRDYLDIAIITAAKVDLSAFPPIMLIGVEGSGKKALASAIASELGTEAYVFMPETSLSKYVGESEKIISSILSAVNDSAPLVLVIDSIENIMGHREDEAGTVTRVRSVIVKHIMSEDRRFLPIFTVSNPSALPQYVLTNPAYGVYKIPILPPLRKEDRFTILSRHLTRYASRYNFKVDLQDPNVREAIELVAERTRFYTPRELEMIARTAVFYSSKKGGVVDKEAIQRAPKYVGVNLKTRIVTIKTIIEMMERIGIPEKLKTYIEAAKKDVDKLEQELGIKVR